MRTFDCVFIHKSGQRTVPKRIFAADAQQAAERFAPECWRADPSHSVRIEVEGKVFVVETIVTYRARTE